ncbi:DUF4148 domain-containing protein [Paraburkholderia sp. BL10I2N1]|uniref:DUF4148 domain-containing protein n=1 Tax=Paraburkholderia sp. BL10I2N1 TaxID=1938796 RepID=UPI00105F3681|nr:DUF4148 domain-containing protein [Paraburkholderia sp. BL10I2N1]TDN63348.1 uncharacterized protein DUF4148 [Paraburkholderia sp. BL10I2N1]
MNGKFAISLSMILLATAGIATSASAQEKTRAEIRQELIQAENNGSRFVTDTSYPDVNPIFVQEAAYLKQRNDSGDGTGMSGSSAAGQRVTTRVAGNTGSPAAACVGRAGFCTPYFGS